MTKLLIFAWTTQVVKPQIKPSSYHLPKLVNDCNWSLPTRFILQQNKKKQENKWFSSLTSVNYMQLSIFYNNLYYELARFHHI